MVTSLTKMVKPWNIHGPMAKKHCGLREHDLTLDVCVCLGGKSCLKLVDSGVDHIVPGPELSSLFQKPLLNIGWQGLARYIRYGSPMVQYV